ncbi:MAG: NUDIX domain-containing protein [Spirochaetota bacterium]
MAAIIIEDEKLLLIAHKKGKHTYWLLPGGGVEYGESLDKALKRELKEELGIDIRVGDIAMVSDSIEPGGKRHIVNITFTCEYEDGEFHLAREKRLYDYSFFPADLIDTLQIFPPINSEIKKLLEGVEYGNIYLGSQWELL